MVVFTEDYQHINLEGIKELGNHCFGILSITIHSGENYQLTLKLFV